MHRIVQTLTALSRFQDAIVVQLDESLVAAAGGKTMVADTRQAAGPGRAGTSVIIITMLSCAYTRKSFFPLLTGRGLDKWLSNQTVAFPSRCVGAVALNLCFGVSSEADPPRRQAKISRTPPTREKKSQQAPRRRVSTPGREMQTCARGLTVGCNLDTRIGR